MRRRYYGKNLPKFASMPLFCPEDHSPSDEELAALGNISIEEGKEYNAWFVSPKDLVGYNFGTESNPMRPIDVNIIDAFNKRRRKNGLYIYSCMPGNIAGHETYEHVLPNVGADYTVFETINGVRKRVEIDAATTTYVYLGEPKTLSLGQAGATIYLYSLEIIDAGGENNIKLEAIQGKGLVDEITNTIVYEDANCNGAYVTLTGVVSTTLELPNWFTLKIKFSLDSIGDTNLIKATNSTSNEVFITVRTASNGSFLIYNRLNSTANSTYSGYSPIVNKIVELECVCNPHSTDDFKHTLSIDGTTVEYISKAPRQCSYTFSNNSTERHVIVNSDTDNVFTVLRDAVWIYLGRTRTCQMDYVRDKVRVIHANPLQRYSLTSMSTNGTSLAGGVLMYNVDFNPQLFSYIGTRIKSLYIYEQTGIGYTFNYPYYYTGSTIQNTYINNESCISVQNGTNLLLGEKSTNYILYKEEGDIIRRGAIAYYKDNEDYYTLLWSNTEFEFTVEEKVNENVYILKLDKNCKRIERNAFSKFAKNSQSNYMIDFGNVERFGDQCFYSCGGVFRGNEHTDNGEFNFAIDSNWALAYYCFGFVKISVDNIYFTKDKNVVLQHYGIKSDGAINIYYGANLSDSLVALEKTYTINSSYCINIKKGNRYVNFKSPIAVQYTGARDDVKIFISDAAKESYICGEELESYTGIDGVLYKRYSYLYYREEGKPDLLVYYATDNNEDLFVMNDKSNIMGVRSYIIAMIFANKKLTKLDISKTTIDCIQGACYGWTQGGEIRLPKTIDYTKNNIACIATTATAANTYLSVYMPTYDNIGDIPVKIVISENASGEQILTNKILFASNTDMEKNKIKLYIPSSQESEYRSRGWDDENFYSVETY